MLTKEQRIASALERRFPNNKVAPNHYGCLLAEYVESGLAPPNAIEELETGDEQKFWSLAWESMLYRHLKAQGYQLRNRNTAAGQDGPDFCFDVNGNTVWVEAVVPSPEGIPLDYLTPPKPGEIKCGKKPDQPRVLRCTSVIADKMKKFEKYRARGIIGQNDCTVIAVSICRLSDMDADGNGISQSPLVMEAVFPIGAIAIPIEADGTLGKAENAPRFVLSKLTGRDIPTGYFLDPRYSGISAVIQSHQRDMHGGALVIATIHNPLATVPLPHGLFGAYKEFLAEEKDEFYHFSDIAPPRG